MSAEWIKFLLVAIVVMVICLGGIGGWLLPQVGVGGVLARAIGGAIGGAIIAVCYQKMIKRPDGA
jgi:hypothetical protein